VIQFIFNMSEKKPKRILIAEDEKAYSRALVLKLRNAGFEAESVENGEEALKVLEGGSYDLLLCDLVMPKMNGFALLEEIKARGLKIPVIGLSNLGQENDENKARDLGAVDFLYKSNTPIINVIASVEKFLLENT
jgi:CheY-like chemotaxis protein